MGVFFKLRYSLCRINQILCFISIFNLCLVTEMWSFSNISVLVPLTNITKKKNQIIRQSFHNYLSCNF